MSHLTGRAAAGPFLLVCFLPLVTKLCGAVVEGAGGGRRRAGHSPLPWAAFPGRSARMAWLCSLFMKERLKFVLFFKLFPISRKINFKPFQGF